MNVSHFYESTLAKIHTNANASSPLTAFLSDL